MELVERDVTLEVIENTPESQSLIIGEVKESSAQESKDFDSVLHTGLGVSITRPKVTSASADSAQDLPRVESELKLPTQNINIIKESTMETDPADVGEVGIFKEIEPTTSKSVHQSPATKKASPSTSVKPDNMDPELGIYIKKIDLSVGTWILIS